MELTQQEWGTIRTVAHLLREQVGASRVVLFGSAARGDMAQDSDIDLLIVLPEDNWSTRRKVSDLCYEACLASNVEHYICPITYTERELAEGPYRWSPLYLTVEREGIDL